MIDKKLKKLSKKLNKLYKYNLLPDYKTACMICDIMNNKQFDDADDYDSVKLRMLKIFRVHNSMITAEKNDGSVKFKVIYNSNRYEYTIYKSTPLIYRNEIDFTSESASNCVDRSLNRIMIISAIIHLSVFAIEDNESTRIMKLFRSI